MNQYSHANLTKDSQGYVYWRGVYVEHYSFGGTPEEQREEQKQADDLIDRCLYLEQQGIEITVNTCIWNWDFYAKDAAEKQGRGINPYIPDKYPIKLARLVTRVLVRFGINGLSCPGYWCDNWMNGGNPWESYGSHISRSEWPGLESEFAALKIDHLRSERRKAS